MTSLESLPELIGDQDGKASATERSGKDGVPESTKQAVREALLEVLGDALDCTRVWSAWSYGTMSQDDFVPVSERVDELVDAVLPLILAERERNDWQPMETAPKDGTPILCADGFNIKIGVRKRFQDDTWEYFRDEEYAPGHTWSIVPTHWMPLPAHPRPTTSATDSAGETR